MKIPQVKVEQFGKEWEVTVDGEQKTAKQLTVLCNVPLRRLRARLNVRGREQKIRDLILKAEAGVIASAKTHWHGNTPMWITYVMEKAGISRAT
ncbi:MAG: hypothetical protein KAS32_31020, partial [Candidatus Peribacteraceae bacterium]|nr:hypothetical protein [Candidatus Peribacteraceae bacterium]